MDLPLRRIDKQSQRHNCREQPVRSKNAWIWICLSLQFAKKHQTLHYRLKPMKQGQFRNCLNECCTFCRWWRGGFLYSWRTCSSRFQPTQSPHWIWIVKERWRWWGRLHWQFNDSYHTLIINNWYGEDMFMLK